MTTVPCVPDASRGRRRAGICCIVAGPLVAAAFSARPATAQDETRAPREALALVVKLECRFAGRESPGFGAGVIIGADASRIYIATASHVVRNDGETAQVMVTWAPPGNDSARATVLPNVRNDFDMAIITVLRSDFPASALTLRSLDRLGDAGVLKFGDAVSPIGCPNERCWTVPVPADRVIGVDRHGIFFQSSFVKDGSSGGGLFNRQWEVVGLVTEDEAPRANAISIDQVLAQARTWRVPVGLRRRAIPRAGYHTVVAISLLAHTEHGARPYEEGRFPSGRVAVVRRTRSELAWHVSATRLAPPDLSVNAGMIGGGLAWSSGRLTIEPFAEVGDARIEGRYDAGGYFIVRPGLPDRYQPLWRQARSDGLGSGGGVDLQVILRPRVILGVTGGHWGFTAPVNVRKIPSFFVGGGLRWGL